MPIHDWTRVTAGTFHAFHTAWIAQLQEALNAGLLPPTYYALAEQQAGELGPDVLTLERSDSAGADGGDREPSGGIAVAECPPRVRRTVQASSDFYLARRRTLVVRHATDDRVVALLEIVSQHNKSRRLALAAFISKAISALQQGFHLLLVDLYPPTRYAPEGIHAAIWAELDDAVEEPVADQPLTLVSYEAGPPPTAYIEPIRVGAELPDMPLFLTADRYVNVPLEATCRAAWRGMPQRWRCELERP
jgi:hypothetical protein